MGNQSTVNQNQVAAQDEVRRVRLLLGDKEPDLSKFEAPGLLNIQRDSYAEFIDHGVSDAFRSVFPIESISGLARIDYVDCRVGSPVFSPSECVLRGTTFSGSLKVMMRLGSRVQMLLLCLLPLMKTILKCRRPELR